MVRRDNMGDERGRRQPAHVALAPALAVLDRVAEVTDQRVIVDLILGRRIDDADISLAAKIDMIFFKNRAAFGKVDDQACDGLLGVKWCGSAHYLLQINGWIFCAQGLSLKC